MNKEIYEFLYLEHKMNNNKKQRLSLFKDLLRSFDLPIEFALVNFNESQLALINTMLLQIIYKLNKGDYNND